MKKIRRENKLIKELIDQYGVKTTDDIKDMLKDLLGETIQTMLEGEIEEELGYSKYNYEEKDTQNSRNGYSPKKVRSGYGEIELDIPRDRHNEFEPKIIPKRSWSTPCTGASAAFTSSIKPASFNAMAEAAIP